MTVALARIGEADVEAKATKPRARILRSSLSGLMFAVYSAWNVNGPHTAAVSTLYRSCELASSRLVFTSSGSSGKGAFRMLSRIRT